MNWEAIIRGSTRREREATIREAARIISTGTEAKAPVENSGAKKAEKSRKKARHYKYK